MTLKQKFNEVYSQGYLANLQSRDDLDIAEVMFAAFQNGADSAFDLELEKAKAPSFEVMEINTLTNMLAWVDSRIEAEVTHRPDSNVWKPQLVSTWGQIRDFVLSQIKIAKQ